MYSLYRCCFVLESDPAVKQILLTMNEQESFIIEDLDDYHLVIKADDEIRIRRELETEVCWFDSPNLSFLMTGLSQLEKNTYSLET